MNSLNMKIVAVTIFVVVIALPLIHACEPTITKARSDHSRVGRAVRTSAILPEHPQQQENGTTMEKARLLEEPEPKNAGTYVKDDNIHDIGHGMDEIDRGFDRFGGGER